MTITNKVAASALKCASSLFTLVKLLAFAPALVVCGIGANVSPRMRAWRDKLIKAVTEDRLWDKGIALSRRSADKTISGSSANTPDAPTQSLDNLESSSDQALDNISAAFNQMLDRLSARIDRTQSKAMLAANNILLKIELAKCEVGNDVAERSHDVQAVCQEILTNLQTLESCAKTLNEAATPAYTLLPYKDYISREFRAFSRASIVEELDKNISTPLALLALQNIGAQDKYAPHTKHKDDTRVIAQLAYINHTLNAPFNN